MSALYNKVIQMFNFIYKTDMVRGNKLLLAYLDIYLILSALNNDNRL